MSNVYPTPRTLRYSDLAVGQKEVHEYQLTQAVYAHFLGAFQDFSPLHVDGAYAHKCGYVDKVMHGSMLNGFLSHFVGMVLPGRSSLLLTVDLRFSQPSYLGDVIRLDALITQKLDARQIIVLDVILNNVTQNCLAARGRVQVMMRDEP